MCSLRKSRAGKQTLPGEAATSLALAKGQAQPLRKGGSDGVLGHCWAGAERWEEDPLEWREAGEVLSRSESFLPTG